MPKTKQIFWFAPYNLTCPSTRYRGLYPLKKLHQDYGVKYDFVIPDRSFKGIFLFFYVLIKAILSPQKNSLIVVQKICSNRFYANLLKLLVRLKKTNTLYDIDDAEYLRQPTETLHFFLKHCHLIQVGSQALKTYCLAFNSNVYVSTSPVSDHIVQKTRRNDKLHLGWVGDMGNGKSISKDFSHKHSLFSILFPQLKKIEYPIKLSLIGAKRMEDIPEVVEYFKDVPNVELNIPIHLNWENDDWLYEEIQHFDIGLSPLVAHPFNVAKSAFKAKQYLSCGVPCIASDVGENSNYVLHQKNGFIAQQPADFLTHINHIATMEKTAYAALMRAAKESVGRFSMKNYCELLLEKTKD